MIKVKAIKEIFARQSGKLTGFFQKKPKAVISIEFGQACLKIAYLKPAKPGFKLVDYALDKITFKKENAERIINFIRTFLNKYSLEDAYVYLTISDPASVAVKHLTLPVLSKEETLRSAKWQLKEDLAFKLEGAIIDSQIVKEYADRGGAKKNDIVFAVASTEGVEKYVSLLGKCQLTPTVISYAPFNYANILKFQDNPGGVQLVVDLGYDETTLYMYLNNKLQFIRKLSFSSERITQALTETVTSDKGTLQLSYQEANEVKEKFGFPQDPNQLLTKDLKGIQVISLIRPSLEMLARELKRTLDYLGSKLEVEIPQSIFIVGGGSKLKNLKQFLSQELDIEVKALSRSEYIDTANIDEKRLNNAGPQLFNVLGAVLSDSKAINLAPHRIKAQKAELIQKVSLRVLAVTVGLIFLVSFLIVKLQIRDYRNRLRLAKNHLETIKEIKVLQDSIAAREGLINKIQKGRVPVDRLLVLLSTIIPNEIVLDKFMLNQDKHLLTLRGYVFSSGKIAEAALVEFMTNLEATSFFSEARLVSSRKEHRAQLFEIQCDLAF